MMGDLKDDERGEPEATLFKTLNLMSIVGTAILGFLIGLVVLLLSHISLIKALVASAIFSFILTYARIYQLKVKGRDKLS